MNIDPAKFAEYMKTKEAYLKIYAASGFSTGKASISLTYEECRLLMKLFNSEETIGFVV